MTPSPERKNPLNGIWAFANPWRDANVAELLATLRPTPLYYVLIAGGLA